ncbi:MAG: hypothetical protein SCALA702_32130 [Melioribacteraceae bacterium]|nr:MAG: hypothetical protein SCALA702_32130 [Melioribacteraceae bacterium]
MDNKKLVIDDTVYETNLSKKFINRKKYEPPAQDKIFAAIPGVIKKIYVKEGDVINRDDRLLILEAMKMENSVRSHLEGKIKKIHVTEGVKVMKNQLLIEFN